MGQAGAAQVNAITGLSSMATQHVLAELAADYSKRVRPVSATSVGGVEAAARVRAGEDWDFVVLAADALAKLEAEGFVVRGSRVDVAASGMAIAVGPESAFIDVSDEEAVRDAVLNARSIGYSTGPSGAHLMRVFDRWGIADEIKPRLVQAPVGVPVGSLVARGEVELGVQQMSELVHVAGIRLAGPLPAAIQTLTIFSGGVCATSKRADDARGFLAFAASKETEGCKRRHGMEQPRRA